MKSTAAGPDSERRLGTMRAAQEEADARRREEAAWLSAQAEQRRQDAEALRPSRTSCPESTGLRNSRACPFFEAGAAGERWVCNRCGARGR